MKTLYYINTTIVALLVLFSIIYIVLYSNNKTISEHFENATITKGIKLYTDNKHIDKPEYRITNLLPLIDEEGYLATFSLYKDDDTEIIDYNTNPKEFIRNNMLKTTNFKGNIWTSMPKGAINENTIIHNLCWHRDELNSDGKNIKRLLCIGRQIKKSSTDDNIYTIYIKKTEDINDEWIEYIPDSSKHSKSKKNINNTGIPISNKMISFIIYDLNNTLLGINDTDNQIYSLDEKKSIWVGPINFSKNIKAKKILYDWDRKMLCLDINNIIWKKTEIDWKISEWKKDDNYNIKYSDEYIKQDINDLIHDTDGHLIAVVPKYGILKQRSNTYSSLFDKHIINDKETPITPDNNEDNTINYPEPAKYYNLDYLKYEDKTLMTKNDILMNKTGIDTEKYDYIKLTDINPSDSKKKLAQKLNFLLKFKRKFVNNCKKRNTNSNIDTNNNSKLYNNIDILLEKLDSKGYYN